MSLARFVIGAGAVLLLVAFGFGYSLGHQMSRDQVASVVTTLTDQGALRAVSSSTQCPAPTARAAANRK